MRRLSTRRLFRTLRRGFSRTQLLASKTIGEWQLHPFICPDVYNHAESRWRMDSQDYKYDGATWVRSPGWLRVDCRFETPRKLDAK
jgi:hypothetical protein